MDITGFTLTSAGFAFIAGIFMFLAPCTLPLVPGYLLLISGVRSGELQDPSRALAARRRIFLNGFFYVLGFSIVFIALGMLAGFLGAALGPYRIWLSRIGGAFVILLGFFMLGAVRVPFLDIERHVKAPKLFMRGTYASSFMLGAAFALGWTPCVGPVLASILLLASTSATALQGAGLLLVFSAGLGLPFLLIALGVSRASAYVSAYSKYLGAISIVGGLLLIFVGILLLTDKFALLISYGFTFFRFLEYERLLNYL